MQEIPFENEFKLSFYKEIAYINESHKVMLVQSIESGDFFVKKTVVKGTEDIYRVLAELQIRGIPKVLEMVDCGDEVVVIEEYIHGKNLERILEEKQTEGHFFSESETCKIISELCKILLPLHSHSPKLIHRDIKPSNLILDSNGNLYLIDFDAAKSFDPQKGRDTVLMGTAEYAAPEQYGFSQSDERTDIYSIGVLMNKMLTGAFPQEKRYGGELGDIINRCISLKPEDRIQGCNRLRSRIAHYERQHLQKPCVEMTAQKIKPEDSGSKRKAGRGKTVITLIIMLLLVLAGMAMDFEGSDGQALEGAVLLVNQVGFSVIMASWAAYIGNLGGIRNRFPWHKTRGILEIFRLAVGLSICLLVPIICEVLIEMAL